MQKDRIAHKRGHWLTFCILLAVAIVGCSKGEGPTQSSALKGNRILSLDVRPSENQSYDAAFRQAQQAGMQAVTLSLDWGEIEPAAGQFNFTLVDIANIYYPAAGTKVGLSVRPVATTYRTLPADLDSLSLDSSVVITRFKALLDSLRARLGALTLTSISIGSEHDIYFGTNATAWAEWGRFYAATGAYAKSLWPAVPVGTEFTYEGLTGNAATYTRTSNAQSDVIVVSYYPLSADFQVQAPGAVREGMNAIAAAYPNRPIHFNQLGYPSSEVNGSSEEKQRQFIAAMFNAWDAHATQIPLVNMTWQTDLSQAEVVAFQNLYGLHDPKFGEFLRTLGLRRYPRTGQDKPAWSEFIAQATARGW